MKKECFDCENENLMRIAELEIENNRLKEWRYQLERSIEHSNKIMEMLRAENEELTNKIMVYQKHCINEKNNAEPVEPKNDYELPFNENVDEMLDNLSNAVKKARDAFRED